MGFQFRQFAVADDAASMRVGTDGILLGAWATVRPARQVLDIGTGCGLLALMAAQRNSSAVIRAIDIDGASVAQAASNFLASPWPERLHATRESLADFAARPENRGGYDVIICNPPFFRTGPKSPLIARQTARHQTALTADDWTRACQVLLSPAGKAAVIVPAVDQMGWIESAASFELVLHRRTQVRPRPATVPRRTLLEFGREPANCTDTELPIECARHQYFPEYRDLTGEFYLATTLGFETPVH